MPAGIEELSLCNCEGFSSHTVSIFVRCVRAGDFQQLRGMYLEQVFGRLDSTSAALDLLDDLATLPKLDNLHIGPLFGSKKVEEAVDALKVARPDMNVSSKRH